MTARVFADDLHGAAWDRVRAIRRDLFGRDERGVALDADRVPEMFQHLLPYASLLTTGEEGALLEFWDALGLAEQEALMSAVEPLATKLREFGLDGEEGLRAAPAPPPPAAAPERFEFSAERVAEMTEFLEAEAARRKGPAPVEQRVMLDLARLCDLVLACRDAR